MRLPPPAEAPRLCWARRSLEEDGISRRCCRLQTAGRDGELWRAGWPACRGIGVAAWVSDVGTVPDGCGVGGGVTRDIADLDFCIHEHLARCLIQIQNTTKVRMIDHFF